MAETSALIALVQPVLHRVSCRNEALPNVPEYIETHQNMSGVGRVHSLRKIPKQLHGITCALIAPVQPVLQRVLCSNETMPNAPKHYETHQNISLGSNGVDRFRSLRKIPMRLRGTNFCTNSSTRFVTSFVR